MRKPTLFGAAVWFFFSVSALAVVMAGHDLAPACPYASESVSGLNRTCVYTCPKGATSITIKSVEICPVSIDVK